MEHPYFSIITCTYNSEQFLDQCIRSVSDQLYDNYEHIIVDGFSTDNTPEIIGAYAKEDSRVRIIKSVPKGISNAMNIGIKESNGQVIQHLHSDDYYHSNQALALVYDTFKKHPRKSMVIGLSPRDIDGTIKPGLLTDASYKRRKLFLRYLIYLKCYIAHPSTFIKKTVFDRHGLFDESFRIAMDYEFWLRVLGKEPYLMINQELTVFRHHEDAASYNFENSLSEAQRAKSKYKHTPRAIIARAIFSKAVELKKKYNTQEE